MNEKFVIGTLIAALLAGAGVAAIVFYNKRNITHTYY